MDRERLTESIKIHEGYRKLPYRDSLGYWTVGYGHLIEEDIVDTLPMGRILDRYTDKDQHEAWLRSDIESALNRARDWIGPDEFEHLSEVRQEVIVEMAFQMGNRINGFRQTRQFILGHDYEAASVEMLDSRWADQTPERAQRLALRMRTSQA